MGFSPEQFARAMKVKRAERGWSQQDLANASSLSLDAVRRYETCVNAPSFPNVIAIADAFGVSIDEFRSLDELAGRTA